MKEIKLRELEKSYESGIINKEEYEKKKKELESMPTERSEEKDEEKDVKFKSDKILIYGLVLLAVIFISLFSLRFFTQEQPETIDELHELNLKGKLKPEQGYLYNDVYSFVKFEELWYTKLVSPKGTRLYNIQFRYGPRELEDIEIEGALDFDLFNNATNYYATFNPTGNDFSHVAIAIADFNQHMIKIFFKEPIAACDRNETFVCRTRPIITCDNTQDLVLYVKEANETRVIYDQNCITIEGSGFELVKGVDKVLLDFYDIIEQ